MSSSAENSGQYKKTYDDISFEVVMGESIETPEADLPDQRGEVDHQGGCTGNRDQAVHGQVHPLPVSQGGKDLQEEGRVALRSLRRSHLRSQQPCLRPLPSLHPLLLHSRPNAH